jgi:hypothetical protein
MRAWSWPSERWLIAVALASGLVGCFEDDPCDSSTELRNGNCVSRSIESDAGGPVPPGFGDDCTDSTNHSDCPTGTDYCAKQPGMDVGYCTIKGCDADPGKCPGGWSCFDLGQFSPELPWICLRP